MSKLNQKGIAPILMILLLLAGLGVGTYLVQNRTNFLPKADVAISQRTPETSMSLNVRLLGYGKPNPLVATGFDAQKGNVVEGIVVPGNEIVALVRVASDVDSANLFAAKLNFDKEKLEVIKIRTSAEKNIITNPPLCDFSKKTENYGCPQGMTCYLMGIPSCDGPSCPPAPPQEQYCQPTTTPDFSDNLKYKPMASSKVWSREEMINATNAPNLRIDRGRVQPGQGSGINNPGNQTPSYDPGGQTPGDPGGFAPESLEDMDQDEASDEASSEDGFASLKPAQNYFIKNWVETKYDNQKGTISLVGGIPSPGFKTSTDEGRALMAKIHFRVKAIGEAKIMFAPDSAIYRDSDNQNILNIKGDASFKIVKKRNAQASPSGVPGPVCGDNVCQEVTCAALGCPAPENAQSCPQDCKKKDDKNKGDINGDKKVDLADLSALFSNFGKPASAKPEADLNSDGIINVFDLGILLKILSSSK